MRELSMVGAIAGLKQGYGDEISPLDSMADLPDLAGRLFCFVRGAVTSFEF